MRTPTAGQFRVGGWGHVLGDEGSGYAIGVAACAAALKASDGRGAPTMLIDRACDHFSLGDVRELVGLTERFALQPSAAAAFAPDVLKVAQQGDIIAGQIVDRAATHLVSYAHRLIDELRLDRHGVLMLGGGLLTNSSHYTKLVTGRASAPSGQDATMGGFDLPPVGGALLKALAELHGRGRGSCPEDRAHARLRRAFGRSTTFKECHHMKRRLIQVGVGGWGATWMEKAVSSPIRYGYSVLPYGDEPLEVSFDRVARCGYDSIELLGDPSAFDVARSTASGSAPAWRWGRCA